MGCYVSTSPRAPTCRGGYGATLGNRYFQLRTTQIQMVPAASLPTCNDAGMQPHTDKTTLWYVEKQD